MADSSEKKDEFAKWHKKKLKVPSILQMEAVECGAAALAMILAYYGRWVPSEVMRVECGVNRDGSKASNILRAAWKFGLQAKGYRLEPEHLKNFKLPVIIFWNFNHFVVLTGIKKDKVFINDPAMGPRQLSYYEFDKSFTGITLVFEPTPEFSRGGQKPSIFKSLKNRIRNSKSILSYIILTGLFLVVPGILVPTFTQVFIDKILVHEMRSWILPLLIAMGGTSLISASLTWLQQYYLLKFEMQLSLTGSTRFFYHVFHLPIDFFFQRQAGEISNRVRKNDTIATLLSADLTQNVLNVAMIIFYAVMMFYYDLVLTLVGIGIVSINFIGLKYAFEKRKIITQKLSLEQGKLVGASTNGLQLIETLKATGSENDFFSNWSGHQAKVLNAEQQQGSISSLLSQLPKILTSINRIVIFGLGGYRVIQGNLTLGMFFAFRWLMDSFVTPVESLVNAGAKIQDASGAMRRLDDVFEQKKDKCFLQDDSKKYIETAKLQGYLELKNVTFGYSILEKPLIEDFNLSLRPGERVALIGSSGSGKSTISKLVAGLYSPWKGEILFDGKERSLYSRDVLNNSIAMVDQDIFLFGGTIKENISMWDSTIADIDIMKATKDARISQDIAIRKNGLSSSVEERGRNFSGGQRQRLEISRALAINPSLLIFDEATSALDPPTEAMIDDQIRKRGCTMLIVAHRLSTIRDCDEIIVLHRGKVVQRGTHQELIEQEGEYADLIKAE